MNQTEAAYLAGVFDGEGSVFMHAHALRGYPEYYCGVSITNSHSGLIEQVMAWLGCGTVTRTKPAKEGWKPIYRWTARLPIAFTLLDAVEPYTIVRKEQIALARRFHHEKQTWGSQRRVEGRRGTLITPPEVLAEYERIRIAMGTVNFGHVPTHKRTGPKPKHPTTE